MRSLALTHPVASLSRGIEDAVIFTDQNSNFIVNQVCSAAARIVSALVFPIFLTLELVFKKIPQMILAYGTADFDRRADQVLKYFLAIIPSLLLGFYSPERMPGFFLKRLKTNQEVRPFGVEKVFGTKVDCRIDYPKKIEDVQNIVREARQKNQQISIIGAGMSQGTQTVPKSKNQRVIDTKHLNEIIVSAAQNIVTVGAGATWEQIQLELDKVGKSAIVKQASDIFSVGGSIGINCHGWAHEYGPISKTVQSLTMIDANGNLQKLTRPRPGVPYEELTDDEKLFKCMFGTLGYFGVIVEATLDIVDNEELIQTTTEVPPEQFIEAYQTQVKGQDVPLFGGRLVLDTLEGDPLRSVCMVSYRKTHSQRPLLDRKIVKEPEYGNRIERVGLNLISHISNYSVKRLLSYFWKREKKAMFSGQVLTRNQALHPPINAFRILHHSDLHTQWLQEYFIEKSKLAQFLRFLGAELKANDVRLVNSTIRPTPKDDISILPYAEQDRYAVVICFAQKKTKMEIEKTKKWIEKVNAYLAASKGVFYQAYMPYATVKQFEACYGLERVQEMRKLKGRFDPYHVFGNAHTSKYYDRAI